MKVREGMDAKIEKLDLGGAINHKLKKQDIVTIYDLWQSTRSELKDSGLEDMEIYQIKIKLQLQSLDLNGKVYQA